MNRTVTITVFDKDGNEAEVVNANERVTTGDPLDYALGFSETIEANGYYVEVEVSYS